MATSFRLSSEHLKKLEYLATHLGKSKAQVVKEAIEMLYEQRLQQSKRSMLDRLVDDGFEPLPLRLDFDASDEDAQREFIRAKAARKNPA